MNKTKFRMPGFKFCVIALAAVLVLGMTSCDDTLTDSEFQGVLAFGPAKYGEYYEGETITGGYTAAAGETGYKVTWTIGSTEVTLTDGAYVDAAAGSLKMTLSAEGFADKTATITIKEKPEYYNFFGIWAEQDSPTVKGSGNEALVIKSDTLRVVFTDSWADGYTAAGSYVKDSYMLFDIDWSKAEKITTAPSNTGFTDWGTNVNFTLGYKLTLNFVEKVGFTHREGLKDAEDGTKLTLYINAGGTANITALANEVIIRTDYGTDSIAGSSGNTPLPYWYMTQEGEGHHYNELLSQFLY